jgi:hypothetical protein
MERDHLGGILVGGLIEGRITEGNNNRVIIETG